MYHLSQLQSSILSLRMISLYHIVMLIILFCYMTRENPVFWLAQVVIINLYVYLKTGLNWPTS